MEYFKSVIKIVEKVQGTPYFRSDAEQGLQNALKKFHARAKEIGRDIENVSSDVYSTQYCDTSESSVASIISFKAKPCKLHSDDAVSILGKQTIT